LNLGKNDDFKLKMGVALPSCIAHVDILNIGT